jgi:serine/threonine protein kinase
MLGAGGMGCAFLCQNHNFKIKGHQWVVVKCFWENISDSLEQLFTEPKTMHDVAGDYVPEILDYGYADNVYQTKPYFVSEYIEGAIDGEAWLEKAGCLDLTTGLQVAVQIAKALQRAHEKGICHLDLKPANLLLRKMDGKVAVKVIDFGLARVTTALSERAESRTGATVFGQAILGTLDYAPPEQRGYAYRYGQPSTKSDVFALGMTMYRLWTGKNPHPFRERDLPNHSALRDLLCDCVAENPEERPESAQYVVSRLNTIKDTLKTEEQQARKKDGYAWQQTRQTDTKSAYQAYLSGNTLKQFANEAKKRLQAIIEKEELAQRQAEKKQKEIAKRKAQEQTRKKDEETQERLAKEREQQARVKKRQAEIATPQRLSALNPLDYLRLLWWVLVMPQDLKTYRNRFGDEDERRVGKWLVSTLTWLPLLMLTLALGLELIPHTADAWIPEVYLSLTAVLLFGWLLTGLFGNSENDMDDMAFFFSLVVASGVASVVTAGVAFGVTFVVAFGVAGGMAFGVVAVGVTAGVAWGVLGGMAFGPVAFVGAFVVAFGMEFGMEFVVEFGVAVVVAVVVVVGVAFLGVTAGVAFVVAFVVAGGMIAAIEKSIENGTPSWIARLAFLLLIISHLFLIGGMAVVGLIN